MSKKQFIKKSSELGFEFETYLIQHPTAYKKVPQGAQVFVTKKGDEQFNEEMLSIAKNMRTRKPLIEAHQAGSGWLIRPLAL